MVSRVLSLWKGPHFLGDVLPKVLVASFHQRFCASRPTVEVLGNPMRRTWSPSPFQARSVGQGKWGEVRGECHRTSCLIRVAWGRSGSDHKLDTPQMIWFQLVGHEHHFFEKVYNTLTAWSRIAQGRAPGSGAKAHGWAGWVLVGEGLKDHWRNWVIWHHGRQVFEENAQHIEDIVEVLSFFGLGGWL